MEAELNLLEEVENALGIDAAKRLATRLGGQIVSVPKKYKDSALEDKIGSDLSKFLVELRGGEDLQVPIGHKYRKNRVRNGVLAHPELSANVLARKYGVTYTRICQIRRELRAQGLYTGNRLQRVGVTRNAVIAHPESSASELAVKLGVSEARIKDIRRQLRKFGTKNAADCEALPG